MPSRIFDSFSILSGRISFRLGLNQTLSSFISFMDSEARFLKLGLSGAPFRQTRRRAKTWWGPGSFAKKEKINRFVEKISFVIRLFYRFLLGNFGDRENILVGKLLWAPNFYANLLSTQKFFSKINGTLRKLCKKHSQSPTIENSRFSSTLMSNFKLSTICPFCSVCGSRPMESSFWRLMRMSRHRQRSPNTGV